MCSEMERDKTGRGRGVVGKGGGAKGEREGRGAEVME